tara:strand:- start:4383 stop:4655 length:273 start_codon:yes stop_codon:yes gene_type:complete
MNFKPVNRHLLVEPIAEVEKKDTGVLLPQEYTVASPFSSYKVLDIASDCSRDILKNNVIVINNSMLEKVVIHGETFYLILENHVMGITSD